MRKYPSFRWESLLKKRLTEGSGRSSRSLLLGSLGSHVTLRSWSPSLTCVFIKVKVKVGTWRCERVVVDGESVVWRGWRRMLRVEGVEVCVWVECRRAMKVEWSCVLE